MSRMKSDAQERQEKMNPKLEAFIASARKVLRCRSRQTMSISNLFIIGAGFTKAVFPEAPLNDELLRHAVGPEPNDSPLGQVWLEYGLSNIEALLTRLDLDLQTGKGRFCQNDRNAV